VQKERYMLHLSFFLRFLTQLPFKISKRRKQTYFGFVFSPHSRVKIVSELNRSKNERWIFAET